VNENVLVHAPKLFSDFNHLLPYSFTPSSLLDMPWLLLSIGEINLSFVDTIPEHDLVIAQKALERAKKSFGHYTLSYSGVAIRTKSNKYYTGGYIECCAYNPSLSPIHTALVDLLAHNETFTDIEQIVLVEKQGAQVSQQSILESIKFLFPEALWSVYYCK